MDNDLVSKHATSYAQALVAMCPDNSQLNERHLLIKFSSGQVINMTIKSISLLALIFTSVIVIKCKPKGTSLESRINNLVVDSDTALYSFIAKRISKASLDSLCDSQEKVVCDLTLSIKEDTIEEVHFNGAYVFDLQGSLIRGFSRFDELSNILKETSFVQFPQYSDSVYGDYGLKIEFSRFCKLNSALTKD